VLGPPGAAGIVDTLGLLGRGSVSGDGALGIGQLTHVDQVPKRIRGREDVGLPTVVPALVPVVTRIAAIVVARSRGSILSAHEDCLLGVRKNEADELCWRKWSSVAARHVEPGR
jgi:hypothetical protein